VPFFSRLVHRINTIATMADATREAGMRLRKPQRSFPIFRRFWHVAYATRPMRGAALVCYCTSSERTTLAAMDAVNRSL
jgi:hypothetical protein